MDILNRYRYCVNKDVDIIISTNYVYIYSDIVIRYLFSAIIGLDIQFFEL